ncbi:hypothetical protein EDD85DRAFT_975181 [Armillaria nabsnona]|nr:hypothetical protein EDD85DRAFT_975181 [Armillaria nabsnona]
MQSFFLEIIMGDVGFPFRAVMSCIYQERPSTSKGCNTFGPLTATAIKRFESFTSAAVLLVQLGYRGGKGKPVSWPPSLEDHLQHVVREIQEGVAPNWFELVRDDENRPDTKVWEISTWRYKPSNHNTELAAYRLLHQLQGQYIPRLFGAVHNRIAPESITLPPITDIVQGLVFEYISGVSMAKLKPSVDVSMREAERISSHVMEAPRALEAENCVLYNDIHVGNADLRDGNRSPVIIDFGQADIREPELGDEERKSVVWGSPDTRRMRNLLVNPEDGPWKRTVTPYEMSDPHYKDP